MGPKRKRKTTPALSSPRKGARKTRAASRPETPPSPPPTVIPESRALCTTCRHHLARVGDVAYCAAPGCNRTVHRYDGFAGGFFCSYSTANSLLGGEEFICAVCICYGREDGQPGGPLYMHPKHELGNLEYNPVPPISHTGHDNPTFRRESAAAMKLLPDQKQRSLQAWTKSTEQIEQFLLAKNATKEVPILLAQLLAAKPTPGTVLQLIDKVTPRTALDGFAESENELNAAGFPSVSGKGMGTADGETGHAGSEEGEIDDEGEGEGDEGEDNIAADAENATPPSAEAIAAAIHLANEASVEPVAKDDDDEEWEEDLSSDGSSTSPVANTPAIEPLSKPPVPVLTVPLPTVPLPTVLLPTELAPPAEGEEPSMKFLLQEMRKVQAHNLQLEQMLKSGALASVGKPRSKAELWMSDKALDNYRDITPLNLDNNQVIRKRIGDAPTQTLREYDEKVMAWKEECEKKGYINLYQKRCTWVCVMSFLCLVFHCSSLRATFFLFLATFLATFLGTFATFLVTFLATFLETFATFPATCVGQCAHHHQDQDVPPHATTRVVLEPRPVPRQGRGLGGQCTRLPKVQRTQPVRDGQV
jgi:hypothetical protein